MAANPQIVNTDVTFTWDGVPVRLMRGTLVDVPSGGALQTAIGGGNLSALPAGRQTSDAGVSVGPFMENTAGGGNLPSVWLQ
jgi:hypothetical protein